MGRIKKREKIYFFLVFLLGLVLIIWSVITYLVILFARFTFTSFFVNFSIILLLSFLIILIMRYFLLIWCSHRQHLETISLKREKYTPAVSILVPAYNEGAGIDGAIQSLLELDYPHLDIIIINDGSTDDTLERAQKWEGTYHNATLRVLNQETNQGKAAGLNLGIKNAHGEIIVCMDGDSFLDRQAILRGVERFVNPEVAAVAGNVKIINRNSFLTKLQALEYIEGLNLVRRAQAFFQGVNIIPGPMGFFRKSVLEEVGGYDSDTFAEDCDLTVKILTKGGRIEYEPDAIAWTEAPETIVTLFKQRYRWTRGILQSLKKHRSFLFRFRSARVCTFVLWYMGFEAVIWPVMNIFGHIFFVFVAAVIGFVGLVLLWWVQLTLLDMIAALYAVALEKEELKFVFYAIFYRIFFVLAIDVAKLLATIEELLGIQMTWGTIERKGRIARGLSA